MSEYLATWTSDMTIENHVSSGGVVYRLNGDCLEVVLCGRNEPVTWSLPKGTPDAGETIEQTALREVREETGLDVVIEDFIRSIKYWFSRDGVRIHKTVHFFLMSPIGGSPDRHDPEFDRVGWFDFAVAIETLTYKNEAHVVEEASKLVKAKLGAGAVECRQRLAK